MNKYTSNISVEGGEITALEMVDEGWRIYLDNEKEPADLKNNIFAFGMPKVGDFIIIHEDDYTTWLPRFQFLQNYTFDEISNIKFLSIGQTCKFLHISSEILAKMRKKGNGPEFHEFSTSIRYDYHTLVKWAESQAKTKQE